MIRFLQTPGPLKKIILSGILLIICGGMVITLIPGGLGSDLLGQPSQGVLAKVAGQNITTQEVRDRARAMAEQQVAQYGPMGKQLLPMIMPRAISQSVEQLITGKSIVAEAERMGLKATSEDVRDELQNLLEVQGRVDRRNGVGQKAEVSGGLIHWSISPSTGRRAERPRRSAPQR